MGEVVAIPARRGKAMAMAAGQALKVINTHGSQVVDLWAFNRAHVDEFMSMEHSRSTLHRLSPTIGDTMVTNRRRPILTLVADTSPGVHDTLLSACDVERYRLLGHDGYHDNCADNLRMALAENGLAVAMTPAPWNLFENVAVHHDGGLEIRPPACKPGDHVVLRADMDLVIAFSACPMDILPTNGADRTPRPAHLQMM
jgi:uncharacterized protein YcgI (DUF1989 family)